MTQRSVIASPHAPAAIGPYSHAIRHGALVWTAGQVGLDPATGELVSGDVAEQTRQVLANLGAVLGAAGCSLADVVKTTVFLADMADFAAMNAVWEKWIVAGQTPARATVEAKLANASYKVEIMATAAL